MLFLQWGPPYSRHMEMCVPCPGQWHVPPHPHMALTWPQAAWGIYIYTDKSGVRSMAIHGVKSLVS